MAASPWPSPAQRHRCWQRQRRGRRQTQGSLAPGKHTQEVGFPERKKINPPRDHHPPNLCSPGLHPRGFLFPHHIISGTATAGPAAYNADPPPTTFPHCLLHCLPPCCRHRQQDASWDGVQGGRAGPQPAWLGSAPGGCAAEEGGGPGSGRLWPRHSRRQEGAAAAECAGSL
jgi:hypothetical protein